MTLTTILTGDARILLTQLPDASVHTCITSPPYFSLRSYLPDDHPDKARELGTEATVAAYVENLVSIFREVRRVLRMDGSVWLNLADSYARPANKGQHRPGDSGKQARVYDHGGGRASATVDLQAAGLQEKSLIGIPWRVALALQADGWILRSDCIWQKPNCLPESVQDRPTRSHEYIFLLAKQGQYWYDQAAIREPVVSRGKSSGNVARKVATKGERSRLDTHLGSSVPWSDKDGTRNARSVWTIPTQAYRGTAGGTHFATFPPALAERMILAGCPPSGLVCDSCDKTWYEHDHQTSKQTGSAAVRTVREDVPPPRSPGDAPLLLARVPQRLHAAAAEPRPIPSVCPVPDDVHAPGSQEGTVLLSRMCQCGAGEAGAAAGMRPLPEGLHPEMGAGSGLLQRDLCEPGESDAAAGPHADPAWLRPAVPAGPSDGDEGWLRDGAPARDGRDTRAPADPGGSRPPSQRDQGRQPAGKSGTTRQADPRPEAEAAAAADHMPPLRGEDRGLGACPTCGGPLTIKPAGVVLDPFAGAGTVGLVAHQHGRRSILLELNAEYAEQAHQRLNAAGVPTR